MSALLLSARCHAVEKILSDWHIKHLLEMSALRSQTRVKTSTPLFDCAVDHALVQVFPLNRWRCYFMGRLAWVQRTTHYMGDNHCCYMANTVHRFCHCCDVATCNYYDWAVLNHINSSPSGVGKSMDIIIRSIWLNVDDPGNNGLPSNISPRIQPKLHMSTPLVYLHQTHKKHTQDWCFMLTNRLSQ